LSPYVIRYPKERDLYANPLERYEKYTYIYILLLMLLLLLLLLKLMLLELLVLRSTRKFLTTTLSSPSSITYCLGGVSGSGFGLP
jgi:hypothetical protein